MLANNSWFRLLGRFQNDFREISLGNLEKRVRKRVPLTQKSYATTFKNARKPSIFKDFEGSGTSWFWTPHSEPEIRQFTRKDRARGSHVT